LDWLCNEKSHFTFESEEGAIDRPIFAFQDQYTDRKIGFQLCPYYGGTGASILWDQNPLKNIFDEKVDVIITKINENLSDSKPVFAVEFVDALMAGNQGWQRFRRATDSAKAGLTYLYVQPIIGWERDTEGLELRNPRFLPAQTSLAQLTLCSKFGVPSLQIYTKSSWSEYAVERGYTLPTGYDKFGGIDNAIEISSNLIRLSIETTAEIENSLKNSFRKVLYEMFLVSKTYSAFSNSSLPIHANHDCLKDISKSADEYAESLINNRPVTGANALHNIGLKEFQKWGALFFKDVQRGTCSSNFYENVLALLNWKDSKELEYKKKYLHAWSIGTTSNYSSYTLNELANNNRGKLPLTYKSNKSEGGCVVSQRKALRDIISSAYRNLNAEFLNWIYRPGINSESSTIFVVPIYAYKPSGDSRPDRGLMPLLWAMFPSLLKKDSTLVIVYSKYTPRNWKSVMQGKGNELWNSIIEVAGGLIVDKTGEGLILAKEELAF
jgi:hypothetical protein